ncbi:HlyC/CorC family transporter [uncultured Cohaesibacter sp.]|uniref:HlyC/CorC family transporter n=1 Tax=uncultured Cohaesibacter sp. TaxID=1002546 RepID=UPI0029C902BD|nr:HlyC/CorC family transporter [uncultured Cohaesibacter sp.]
MFTGLWLTALAILLLIIASGFFSGSETALTAASRARMHQKEKAGEPGAQAVNELLQMRERLIGSLLLGNNLVNILASALATSLFINLFGDTGVVYATLVMTVVVLVFAEVMPKTWAISNPDSFAQRVGPTVRVLTYLLGPIVATVEWVVIGLLRLLGVNTKEGQLLSGQDELRGAVDLLHMEGSVVKDDRDRFGGLLDLEELDVSDVMVHRTNVVSINLDDGVESIVEQVLKSPYTRIPLWQGEQDNFVGVIHSKDLLRALADTKGDISQIDFREVAREPWFVPDTTSLKSQLNAFLKKKSHFALVVDEYGEVMGLVTLEDILEEIVGDISDEHDIDVKGVRKEPDGSILVDGNVPIRDLNRALDWELPDEEATTIAGLVIHEARQIPEPGQGFTFYNFRFRVLRKDRNRITSLRITPVR